MHSKPLSPTPLYAAIILALLGGNAFAGGLGITIQSGVGGGNASTGHAMAEDVSAMFYNPALLFSMEGGRQLNTGFSVVNTDVEVTNTGSTIPSAAGGFPVLGNNVGEPGGAGVTPSFFYRGEPIKGNFVYGVGVNVPAGVHTEYEKDSFARYEALESSLATININPAIAWRASDKFDFGAGLNLQVGQATLTRAIDSYLVCQSFAGAGAIDAATCGALGLNSASNTATDGKVEIEADGVAYGANIGAAYRPDDQTTLSFGYRSKVKYDLEGEADFSHSANLSALGAANLAAAGLGDQKATAELTIPASASLSAARKISDKLTVYGDVTWTEWSSLPELRIKFPETNSSDSVTTFNWEDTVRFGAGMTYQLSEKTRLRTGIAQDPTPTPSANNRTPRAPSSDNLWLSAGVSHQINKHFSIDAGLSLVKPSAASINYTSPGSSDYTTRADVDSDVWVGAASLNYRF